MQIHPTAIWTALLATALLAGCAAPGNERPTVREEPQWTTPGPRGGLCDAAPAQAFVGQQSTASVSEKARVASGAAMARVLHPNQATTREFNAERLNLLVDASGRITAVRCG